MPIRKSVFLRDKERLFSFETKLITKTTQLKGCIIGENVLVYFLLFIWLRGEAIGWLVWINNTSWIPSPPIVWVSNGVKYLHHCNNSLKSCRCYTRDQKAMMKAVLGISLNSPSFALQFLDRRTKRRIGSHQLNRGSHNVHACMTGIETKPKKETGPQGGIYILVGRSVIST